MSESHADVDFKFSDAPNPEQGDIFTRYELDTSIETTGGKWKPGSAISLSPRCHAKTLPVALYEPASGLVSLWCPKCRKPQWRIQVAAQWPVPVIEIHEKDGVWSAGFTASPGIFADSSTPEQALADLRQCRDDGSHARMNMAQQQLLKAEANMKPKGES